MGWLDGYGAQHLGAVGFLPYAWQKLKDTIKGVKPHDEEKTVEGHRVLDDKK